VNWPKSPSTFLAGRAGLLLGIDQRNLGNEDAPMCVESQDGLYPSSDLLYLGDRGADQDAPSEDDVKLSEKWSNKGVNEAGEFLARSGRSAEASSATNTVLIVSDWRSAHEYPLKMVMSILRRHIHSLGWPAVVSGRTKRLRSIVAKLVRQPTMALTTMQDIGGCRAVVDSSAQVEVLASNIRSGLAPRLSGGGMLREYDYIAKPKGDGYRSIHFVARYQSKSDRFKDLKVQKTEIQIRSLLQHRWATAVETVDLFTGQTLKTGGGDQQWRRFFVLAGSLFALKENCQVVPGTPNTVGDLMEETKALAVQLRVVERIRSWSEVMHTVLEGSIPRRHKLDRYSYLVELDVDTKTTRVTGFDAGLIILAHSRYRAVEQANAKFPNRSAVLVSAYSLADVKQAYPGYYGDTKAFLTELGLLPRDDKFVSHIIEG
jgi:ppGpp synthetase/RelA/SpoT-type nucleotidyltranferase